MSIANYLKEIGRGKDGARAHSAARAEDLLRQAFERWVCDLQRGAFVIAMRIKGESRPQELAGFRADVLLLRGAEATLVPPSVVPLRIQAQVNAISSLARHGARPLENAA